MYTQHDSCFPLSIAFSVYIFLAPWSTCARKMTANIWKMMTILDLPRKMCNNKLYNSPEKRIDIKSYDRNYRFCKQKQYKHLPNTCRQTGVMAFFSKFHFLLFFSSTDIYDETTERKVKKKPRFIVGLLDKRR